MRELGQSEEFLHICGVEISIKQRIYDLSLDLVCKLELLSILEILLAVASLALPISHIGLCVLGNRENERKEQFFECFLALAGWLILMCLLLG